MIHLFLNGHKIWSTTIFVVSRKRNVGSHKLCLGAERINSISHVTVNITFKNTLVCLFTDLGRHKLSNAMQHAM